MSQAKKPPVHALQEALRNEASKLKGPRVGIIKLQCCLCHPTEAPLAYSSANLCALLDETERLGTGAIVYLHPIHLTQPPPTPDSSKTEAPLHPETQLLHSIQYASILGGDKLTLRGRDQEKGKKKGKAKNGRDPRTHYIRCQCSTTYEGGKIDQENGQINVKPDRRKSTIRNDRNNCRHGLDGRHGSHKTDTSRPLTSSDDHCSFYLSIYRNSHGYYAKGGHMRHEFHA